MGQSGGQAENLGGWQLPPLHQSSHGSDTTTRQALSTVNFSNPHTWCVSEAVNVLPSAPQFPLPSSFVHLVSARE